MAGSMTSALYSIYLVTLTFDLTWKYALPCGARYN